MSGLALTARAVTKTFAGRSGPVEALRPVDLDVAPGEFVVLIGPSGCGKTTLLRLLGGLERPTSGTLLVGGAEPAAARQAKRFALVPQQPALLPWRTVRANVGLLGDVNRSSGRVDAARVEELIRRVGLERFADALPHELSGGMAQRVALARAFALGAPVLLMDEPLAALDEITRASMRELLVDLWMTQRPTVVFTTHSLEEAVLLADRVLVMGHGRVHAERRVALPRPWPDEVDETEAYLDALRTLRHDLRAAMTLPDAPVGPIDAEVPS